MYRHCPSAKIVSNASDDLPEPETPVTTVTRSCGIPSETFFRLFCRAPSMRSQGGCDIRRVLLRRIVYRTRDRAATGRAPPVTGRSSSPGRRSVDEARASPYPQSSYENHSKKEVDRKSTRLNSSH